MKKILFSIICFAIAVAVSAVPAKRGVWKTVKLADGREVRVELRGDEYLSYWQAENGERYVKADGHDWFVKADMAKLRRNAAELRLQNPLPFQSQAQSRVELGGNHPDFIGAKKGLIILAEFTDKKFQSNHTAEYYTHVANDLNFSHPDGFVGSIRDYFLAQSGGLFDVTFDIAGPIQMKYDMAHYGANNILQNDFNVKDMVVEAVQGAQKQMQNFLDYDWDGDGFVDLVFVIYAGRGEASGGGENTIWPHRGALQLPRKYGGKYVQIYACCNEMKTDTQIDGIGPFCHEFSHCLGLADLYDTSYSGENYGMACWDVMHQGNYLGNAFRPCGYSGYEKAYLGWKEPVVLSDDTSVKGMKGISEGGEFYYVYNDAYTNEFYVLENRTKTGWDAELPNAGLLISHIDFDKAIWANNIVNTTSEPRYNDHQRYTAFLADNSSSVVTWEGDVYPYKRNNLLTDYSVPASILYHKNTASEMFMNKPITNIEQSADGSISFDFRNEVGLPKEQLPAGIYFRERFDYCIGDGGNDGVWNPKDDAMCNLMPENTGWEISDGRGGNKCAILGKASKPGTAITPIFTISGPAVICFKGAMFVGAGGNKITLSVNSGNATVSQTSFTLGSKKWTDFRTELTAPSYPVEVSLKFNNNSRYCFLDDIYVQTEEMAGIDEVTIDDDTSVPARIFTIDGRFVGNDVEPLSPGLYIRNGKKIVVK